LADEVKDLRKQLEEMSQENKMLKDNLGELKLNLANVVNEVVERTTGINQPLVALTQSINQLKTLISLVVNQQHEQVLQQPISTQEIVINGTSSLFTSSHFDKLKEWIPKYVSLKTCRLDLLYKSSRDGFKAQTFHQMCESRSPTIIFIKSQTYGRIFGGYTEQTWDHTGYFKNDEEAFLFSLTYNEKYPLADCNAIFCKNHYSATFGSGHDIHISDSSNSNSQVSSYSNFPHSYKCSKFTKETEESKAYLAGSYKFKVEEIEVYQIVWV